ncbi:23 kDa jasmonate-induced protein-like [Ziziphus jujuba]|uniref:23 kDa jasmonate-induced protein-like n=1 Tax=Ziziphus jujuba TaxID=326968 RepID=A0ABM3I0I1_ZIZJJ|nr:23 kDa jasmonate-induced protein-like [Ziziphus jujuba]
MAIENLFTLGKIYNATGIKLSGRHHDWYGVYGSQGYPAQLDRGQKGWFIHLGSVPVAGPPARSSGAIVYRGHINDELEFDWIVAWDNQINSPNKVYTSVRAPVLKPVDWNEIQQELINSKNESTSSDGGLLAHVSIGDGNFPVLRAVLSPQAPSRN